VNGVNLLPVVIVLALVVVFAVLAVIRRRRKTHRRVDMTVGVSLDMTSNPLYHGGHGAGTLNIGHCVSSEMVNNAEYESIGRASKADGGEAATLDAVGNPMYKSRQGPTPPYGVWVDPSEEAYLRPQTASSATEGGTMSSASVGMQEMYNTLPPARPPKPIMMHETYNALPPATQPPPAHFILEESYDALPPALPLKARHLTPKEEAPLVVGDLYQIPANHNLVASREGTDIRARGTRANVQAEETYDLALADGASARQTVMALNGTHGATMAGQVATPVGPQAGLYDVAAAETPPTTQGHTLAPLVTQAVYDVAAAATSQMEQPTQARGPQLQAMYDAAASTVPPVQGRGPSIQAVYDVAAAEAQQTTQPAQGHHLAPLMTQAVYDVAATTASQMVPGRGPLVQAVYDVAAVEAPQTTQPTQGYDVARPLIHAVYDVAAVEQTRQTTQGSGVARPLTHAVYESATSISGTCGAAPLLSTEEVYDRAAPEGQAAARAVSDDAMYDLATTQGVLLLAPSDMYDLATASKLQSSSPHETPAGESAVSNASTVRLEEMYDRAMDPSRDRLVSERRDEAVSAAAPMVVLEDMYGLTTSTDDDCLSLNAATQG
jgi:hypothetical protein